jgi:WYL domain
MARTKNTSALVGQRVRIRIIHEIILHEAAPTPQGLKARDFLLQAVNKKLELRGLPVVSVKTLEADIHAINQGNFQEADLSLPPLPDGKRYDLRYNHLDKQYTYHQGRIPDITFLDSQEEHSLSFLKGILAQYSDIPAVQRLMQESPAFFNQDLEAVDTQQAFLVNTPAHQSPLRKKSMMEVTLRLLDHIKQQEVVQFEYVESQKLEHFTGIVPGKQRFRVYPLCLRLHDGFYHLCALSQVNPESKKPNKFLIRNFRIDHIESKSLTKLRDPKLPHTFERFNAAELWIKYDVQKKLKKAIGVWNMPDSAIEETVSIRFYGWAANHLMVFQVHPSQELLDINTQENYIDLKFRFYTYPKFRALAKPHRQFHHEGLENGAWSSKKFPFVDLFERYPEAGYLLGKYVNFMHVLS